MNSKLTGVISIVVVAALVGYYFYDQNSKKSEAAAATTSAPVQPSQPADPYQNFSAPSKQ